MKVKFGQDNGFQFKNTFDLLMLTDILFDESFDSFSSYTKGGYIAPSQLTGRAKAGLAQLDKKVHTLKKTRLPC